MRVLIDECVPRPLLKFLAEHSAVTVQEMQWGAYENGDLFLTADQNIRGSG